MRLSPALLVCACGSAAAAPPTTVPITLPGAAGGIGFDDLRFAPGLRKVLVPAGRSGNLALIDPKSREITTISGFTKSDSFGGGHGEGITSVDEGPGLLFATDRNAKRLDVVDPVTRTIVAFAPLAGGPDYVRWVAATHEIWVTEPNTKQIEIFTLPAKGTPTPALLATIKVDNGPESLVIDATRGRAYTHRWDDRTHAIDLKTRATVATWPNGCKGSRGIALDEPRGLLFVGCDEGKAVVLDVAHDGKMLSSLSPGVTGVDVIAYNPTLAHLYLPGEDSKTMAILGVQANGALTPLATVATAAGAHCVTQDDRAGVWVCVPETGQILYFQDTLPASNQPGATTFNFDQDAVDQPPKGFRFGRTGGGAEGKWVVKADSGGNVLAQVDADATDYRFPVAFTGPDLKDLRLSVKCKPVSGIVDQGCGLVFRLADPDNYYVTRANALEDNVRLYHVVKGRRIQFGGWDGKVASGQWHQLAVSAKGDHFQVFFDGKPIIDAHDRTFTAAGKFGLWTKADSVVYFDDLTVTPE